MKRSIIIGSAMALLSVPAIAQMAGRDGARMAEPVTRAQIEARVKERFAAVDDNRDGSVTREEIVARREARRDERRDRAFAAMDADGNGAISRAEFDSVRERRAEMRKDRRAGKGDRGGRRMGMRHGRRHAAIAGVMWGRADANADGRITLNEALARPMQRFDSADANKDGTLTIEERRDARQQLRELMRGRRG